MISPFSNFIFLFSIAIVLFSTNILILHSFFLCQKRVEIYSVAVAVFTETLNLSVTFGGVIFIENGLDEFGSKNS